MRFSLFGNVARLSHTLGISHPTWCDFQRLKDQASAQQTAQHSGPFLPAGRGNRVRRHPPCDLSTVFSPVVHMQSWPDGTTSEQCDATFSGCLNRRLKFLPPAVTEQTAYQIDTKVSAHLKNLRAGKKLSRAWRSVSWPGGFLDPARAARLKSGPSIGLGQKELAGHLHPFLVGHVAGQVGHGHAAILSQSAQGSRHQPLQAGG